MKENITVLMCFNLVNENGNKLRLYLGRDESYTDCYGNPDKGFRWSFVGFKIPMPVRSGTWFNGFPVDTMLSWLKGNGWALHTSVEMCTGRTTVYDLPFIDGPNKGNENPYNGLVRNQADEEAFCETIRELAKNGRRIRATRLYRYANGGDLNDAVKAVREICGEV